MPMPADYQTALLYLDANKAAALPLLSTTAEQARVVNEIRDIVTRLYDRKPEDLRAAVTMAVDAAKTLTTISIAFFVALGGFMVQYANTHDSIRSASFVFLVLAAVFAVASMISGFYATGAAFKNAQGLPPATATTEMWSTVPLKMPLTIQSWAGLAGLILFAASLLFWSVPPSGGLSVSPVTASSPPPTAPHRVRIQGSWSNLTIRRDGLSFSPGAVPAGQTSAVDVELR
jgi:hypothetical protein